MKKLDIGSMYGIKYKSTWESLGVVDVVIIGTTVESESKSYMDETVYKKFFGDFGIGISTYVRSITPDTPIYVCKVIKSRDPIEYEDDPILIPQSILDYENITTYMLSEHVTVTVSGISKAFPVKDDRGSYIKTLPGTIRSTLRHNESIGGIPIEVSLLLTEYIQETEEYAELEDIRESEYKLVQDARRKENAQHEIRMNSLKDRAGELADSKTTYTSLIEEVNETRGNISKLETLYKARGNDILNIKGAIDNLLVLLERETTIIGNTSTVDGSNYLELKDTINTVIRSIGTNLK